MHKRIAIIMIRVLSSLFVFITITTSCNNADDKTIEEMNHLRPTIGLKNLDHFIEDSTFEIKIISEDYISAYQKSFSKADSNVKYEARFYTDKNQRILKTLFLKYHDNDISLIEEEDKYISYENNINPTHLIVIYNYKTKESSYRIDSFPSKSLIIANNRNLKEAYNYAKDNKLHLCGTAAGEIKTENFPTLHNSISKTEFFKQHLIYK